MKRALALAIQVAALAYAAWATGSYVRGPFADESIPRELATGASIFGAAWALQWSARELERER